MASLKGYLEALSPEARRRYTEKIGLVDNLGPYMETKKTWSTAVEDYPGITYPDIVAYLLFAKSAYTNEELRNYKSLEAYNQFVCGWVRDICDGFFHSQHFGAWTGKHQAFWHDNF